MAESLRRHKIPPSTSYITAQLSACANVFSPSALLLELTAIVLKYFPNALLSVSLTDIKHNSNRRLSSDPCSDGVVWISGSYLPLIGAL